MSPAAERLTAALSRSYRLERELGQGGMATELAAESRGSADVTEVTSQPTGGQCSFALPPLPKYHCRFSDLSRAATEGSLGARQRDPDPRKSFRAASAASSSAGTDD